MAATLNKVASTATNPATATRVLNPDPINFGADWRVLREGNNELILTNINEDIRTPEKLRFSYSTVTDIFKGSDVQTTYAGYDDISSRGGSSVLVQWTGSVNDGQGLMADFPAAVHFVLKVPTYVTITPDIVKAMLERALGSLYETGSETMDTRVQSILRGALSPVGL